MNHGYRSIYNAAIGTWVAVSEFVRARTKSCSTRLPRTTGTAIRWQGRLPADATALKVLAFFCLSLSTAHADTTIDVSTDLPWSASGTSTSPGSVLITGTTASSSSSNYLTFDATGSWIITNDAAIYATSNTPIESFNSGSAFNITNNGSLIGTDSYALSLFNVGNVVIYNYGTIQTLGTANLDPIHVENLTGSSTRVYNYGTIDSAVSNPIEIHEPFNGYVYNAPGAQIIARGTRFAVYSENGYTGTFSLVNDGSISALNTTTLSITAGTDSGTSYLSNNGTIDASYLYFGQTYGDSMDIRSSTSIANSSSGKITTLADYSIRYWAPVKDFSFTNAGNYTANGYGTFTMYTGGTRGSIYGNFLFNNSGTLLSGTGGSVGSAIYIQTLGADAVVDIKNSGLLRGYDAVIDVANENTAIPVTIDNAQGAEISNTSTDSSHNAISVSGGSVAINNAGTIASPGGAGIVLTDFSDAGIVNSGVVTGATFGIHATTTEAGNVGVTNSGRVTGGTAAGISTATLSGASVSIDLGDGADVSAASGVAIVDTLGNAAVTMNSGSKLSGQVLLGEGDDTMIVRGSADITGATLLDGGNSTDSSVSDVLGTTAAATNKLAFEGTTQRVAGSALKNWQTVTLDGANVTFAGDAALVSGTGTNGDGSLQGLVLKNASTLSSPVSLAVTGDLHIDATSALYHALGGSITGDVSNAGLLYWQNLGRTLTLHGDYTGVAGSRLSLESWLAGDSSATDALHVTGNTTGNTTISVRPVAGSPGAQTVNGIRLIQVDGSSDAGSFTLANTLQAGAYQYLLKQGSALDANDWYLSGSYDCQLSGSCTAGGNPGGPAVYRPGTANYVAGQSINAEQGVMQLSTYHQRFGAQHAVDAAGRTTWLRGYAVRQGGDGKQRFEYDSRLGGVQLGQEVWLAHGDNGSDQRAALTLDYAKSDADIRDVNRRLGALDTGTGDLDASSVALGGTYTVTDGQGGYLDLVGQLSHLRNHYKDSYGDKSLQEGWRTALSIEGGKAVARLGDWQIEPQGQLIYMHTRYKSFDDAIAHVGSYTAALLRGRLGLRLFLDPGEDGSGGMNDATAAGTRLYGIVNVLHDFTTPDDVPIGATKVSERYSRTRGEAGLGFQHSWKKGVQAYADLRYQQSLDGERIHSTQASIGVRVAF